MRLAPLLLVPLVACERDITDDWINGSPVVSIQAPASKTSFEVSDSIEVLAIADDPDTSPPELRLDATLNDEVLDGVSADEKGTVLFMIPGPLTPARYTLRLVVTDPDDASGEDEVVFFVQEKK